MRVVVRPHDTLAPCEWVSSKRVRASGVAFVVAWRRKALEVALMIPDLSDKAITAALFRLLDEIEAKAMATDRRAPISANNTGRVLALRLGLPTRLGKRVAKAANWRNGYYQHKRP